MMMQKYVYLFNEGNSSMRDLLGGKGANLAEMTKLGLPVPEGFTISTAACTAYYEQDKMLSKDLKKRIIQSLSIIEEKSQKQFGNPKKPLLVSVRSGAVHSMPGMMDTVLNLGLNDETVQGLAKLTNNKRFAYDSYRRFIQMFSDVVLDVDLFFFENILENYKNEHGYTLDTELSAEDWIHITIEYKRIVKKQTKIDFPQDPHEQLILAVKAVFNSWNNQRAIVYRKLHGIPDHLGTAVTVQSMVFGNMGEDCGTGVAFTRNPSTGDRELYGEYLTNAQGEDVVAGIRTPESINSLKEINPDVYNEFKNLSEKLEKHYKDMQDIEFTIEKNKLYILQTRSGKRTAEAAIKIAVEMKEEGIIDKNTALLRVDPDQLNQLLHSRIDDPYERNPPAKGLPASPGAATGKVVFTANDGEEQREKGEKVILVRPETTPDDIHGMIASEAILTSRGGMTSHAAVVARGMGKACIAGCEALKINIQDKEFTVGNTVVKEGDLITVDGSTGDIMLGDIPRIEPDLSEEFKLLLSWADDVKTLTVRANADNKQDAEKALEFGAKGIGLCRTEHMFMEASRSEIVQRMILARDSKERKDALDQLLPLQQGDFEELFEAMDGLPITIRLLDPSLHEFLPSKSDLIQQVTKLEVTEPKAKELLEIRHLLKQVENLEEFNPMLGHRGCRLGISYPEIYEMQARAIFYAAEKVQSKGIKVFPEIMIPLVGHATELKLLKERVNLVADEVQQELQVDLSYSVGTMIELPRAALTADQIAKEAEFFSFGTNDLTQTSFGFSRDDAEGKFLQTYVEKKILPVNPFVQIDEEGVGQLIKMGVKLGKKSNPEIMTGICGEHGGEKNSIKFCHEVGLDYVSCSPFRVPLARLAAAQATILNK